MTLASHTHSRDQKKGQYCVVHGSRKQWQCSEVATRALAHDWTQWPKTFSMLCTVSWLCTASVSRHQTSLCTRLATGLYEVTNVIPSTYWVDLIPRPCPAVEAGNEASTHISWYPPHRMQRTSEWRAVLRTVASLFPWPWLHPQKHKQPCWTPALVRTQRAYWTHMDIGLVLVSFPDPQQTWKGLGTRLAWYVSTIHHWNSFSIHQHAGWVCSEATLFQVVRRVLHSLSTCMGANTTVLKLILPITW